MALSKTELNLLTAIQNRLGYGDISFIAKTLGYSRQYTSQVLSPSNDFYNSEIVEMAFDLVHNRMSKSADMLQSLKNG